MLDRSTATHARALLAARDLVARPIAIAVAVAVGVAVGVAAGCDRTHGAATSPPVRPQALAGAHAMQQTAVNRPGAPRTAGDEPEQAPVVHYPPPSADD